MPDNVIIEHADGRRYSVAPSAHKALYPDFEVVGTETPADFIVTGIPKPPRKASRPVRRKAAVPVAKVEPEAAAE